MVKYLGREKLGGYLKLKKQIALFLGIGEHFESKTFDWIKLEYFPEYIKCTKICSFDEGSSIFNDVKSFSTVNDMEQEMGLHNEDSTEGTLEHCLNWITANHKTDTNTFVLTEDLNEIYAALVENGELGN